MAAKCLLACQLLRNHVVVSASMEHMASVYLSFRPVPTQGRIMFSPGPEALLVHRAFQSFGPSG